MNTTGDDIYDRITKRVAQIEREQGKLRVHQEIEIDEASLADLRKRAGDLYFNRDSIGERFIGARLKPIKSVVRFFRVT